MNIPLVRLSSVSKRFSLHHKSLGLKQSLIGVFKSRWRSSFLEDFSALSDISLSLEKGDSLALLGHNGSGKSTLLQIIAGIIRPNSGSVITNGKVIPLIELGVGFHHELTGEENIYLNASLLGLSNREIKKKYNEIVEFSGLGSFIDTPVKHYSSGMYMRLGFSVAVNANPDVLLADEILAVGDIEFQEKCKIKIRELQDRGMALILVTHSLDQAKEFCRQYVRLDHGRIVDSGRF